MKGIFWSLSAESKKRLSKCGDGVFLFIALLPLDVVEEIKLRFETCVLLNFICQPKDQESIRQVSASFKRSGENEIITGRYA